MMNSFRKDSNNKVELALLKVKHAVSYNRIISSYCIPLIKAFLCRKQCNFRRTSATFDPTQKTATIDENSFLNNEKILVCGLPKSGNTWLCYFLGEYFSQPLIHLFLDQHLSGIAIFHFPPGIEILHRTDILRCVYIIRDIRDVICSFYHYAMTPYHLRNVNTNYNPNLTIEQFYFEYFLGVIINRYKWLEHAKKYQTLGVPMVRYEDLLQDTEKQYRRLLEESNIKIHELLFKKALERSSFKNLKKSGGYRIARKPSSVTPVHITHFRRGKSGGWKDTLPEHILEDITIRFGEYLQKWGYKI